MSNVTQPLGLLLLGIVASILFGGTFALLILGQPVPEPVWVAWGVVVTALFGHSTFLAQAATHRAVMGLVLDAVTAGAEAATKTTPNGTTTTTGGANDGV